MDEPWWVLIIVAVLGSGAWATITAAIGARKRTADPVTQDDVVRSEMDPAQQYILSRLQETERKLESESAKSEKIAKELHLERQRGNDQAHSISELRRLREVDLDRSNKVVGAYKVLMEWAKDVHSRWSIIRLDEEPPRLPEINID